LARRRLTLAQKKSVPRSLRGASKKRTLCSFCGKIHVHLPLFCDANPNAEENKRKKSEGAGRAGKAMMADPEFRRKLDESRARWMADPENRKAFAESSRKSWYRNHKPGSMAGPKNPHYGHKHSLQWRIEASRRMTETNRRRAKESLHREVVLPRADIQSFPTPLGFDRMADTGWIPTDHTYHTNLGFDSSGFGNSDDFDPFH
jgi:hypothetical protein